MGQENGQPRGYCRKLETVSSLPPQVGDSLWYMGGSQQMTSELNQRRACRPWSPVGRDGLRRGSSAGEAWKPERVRWPWLGKVRSMCQFAMAGVTNNCTQSGLNDKIYFLMILEAKTPRSKCWPLVYPKASLLGLWMATFSLCPQLALSLSVCIS